MRKMPTAADVFQAERVDVGRRWVFVDRWLPVLRRSAASFLSSRRGLLLFLMIRVTPKLLMLLT